MATTSLTGQNLLRKYSFGSTRQPRMVRAGTLTANNLIWHGGGFARMRQWINISRRDWVWGRGACGMEGYPLDIRIRKDTNEPCRNH